MARPVASGFVPITGTRLTVDRSAREVDTGPRAHVAIVIEQRRHLLLRHVLLAAESGEQLVVPVPPVKRGTRHERMQARAERDGRSHHNDREDGADDRGTHRHGVAAGPGIERETNARDRRRRETGIPRLRGSVAEPRRRARSGRRAIRWGAWRNATTTATAPSTTMSAARPAPSTVQSTPIETCSTLRTGPSSANGEMATATTAASSEPEHDRADDAEQAVPHRRRRTCAERSHDGAFVRAEADLAADQLARDEQRGDRGDHPNTPSAIDSGSMARSAFASAAAVMSLPPPLNCFSCGSLLMISFSTVAALRFPPTSGITVSVTNAQHGTSSRHERGSEEHPGVVVRVDLILDDLRREDDDPDQLQIDLEVRPRELRSRRRL